MRVKEGGAGNKQAIVADVIYQSPAFQADTKD